MSRSRFAMISSKSSRLLFIVHGIVDGVICN
jgi:hypothetical protein